MGKKNKRRKVIRPAANAPREKKTAWQKYRRFLPIGFILGLIGLLPTIASYTTKISIDMGTQIDQAKPFSFPATINNGGTFPVQLQEYILGWSELKTSKGDVLKNFVLAMSPYPAAEIYPGGKFDLVIPLDQIADVSPSNRLTSPGATIESCNLLIGVKCKTLWLITQYQIFHFRAVVKPDGQTYWSPEVSFSDRSVYKTLRGAVGKH